MDKSILNEYVNKLNKEQQSAVTYGGGSAVILAAAGSGKTSTLTTRIAYLHIEKEVPLSNILAVTFTNKAAKEMSVRLQKMEINVYPLWIGTFHGICNKILRNHATEVGYQKNFHIMDSQEQESYFKRVLRNNKYDPKNMNVSELLDKINGYKEVAWRSNRLKQNTKERTVYELYEQACIRDNMMDFGELMLSCYELLQNNEHLLDFYSEKFQYILVDEFQDTNELQYKWLKMLASKHKNIFAVGDDDQCLIEGTLVLTPNGEKPIQNIEVGDLVIAKAGEKFFEKRVLNKFSKHYYGSAVELLFDNGAKVTSTPEHTWFVESSSNQNNIDNSLTITLCGNTREDKVLHTMEYCSSSQKDIIKVANIGLQNAKNQKSGVFTFSFDDESFYNINSRKEYIEYKIKDLEIIYKANFNQTSFDHILAKDIKVGMTCLSKFGEKLIVKEVRKIEVNTNIYDINVEDLHNFFANGVLTHNSIYGFRGANPENINLLKRDFSAHLIKIEKNYRSDANILVAANKLISFNKNRQGKNLMPTYEAKNKLLKYQAFNDSEESAFIANKIKDFRREGLNYKNMAILYRTNGQSRSLEKALKTMGIPYIIYGGFRFFDRQEVKNAMAYLRLAYNPKDNMAFLRVVNLPVRSIGETTVKKLEVLAQEKDISLYESFDLLDLKLQKKFEVFIDLIDELHRDFKTKDLKELVKTVIVKSGLENMYENDKKEGPERLDNLYELISAAEVFMSENKGADIQDFLAFSTLDSDMNTKKRDDNADVVKMMTVHASKGLEFDVVFVSGMEEGLFPHSNSLKEAYMIEEERRLMYVALTRAKKHLFLTHSEERLMHGQRNMCIPTRFFKEIPKEVIAIIK